MIQTVQSGLLLVNKPSGPTSYDIIRWIKKAAKPARVGHSGTLDPLASGLLILLLGSATKRQSEVMKLRKIYRCVMKLGVKTDSGDMMGNILEEKPVPSLTPEQINSALDQFRGEIDQIPPMFAAIKKDGVPLYKLARKGITVERTPRRITIYAISLLNNNGNEIEFRAECSAGTYVRTLVEDIAAKLGTVAAVSALEREAIGPYTVSNAVPGEQLKTMNPEELWHKVVS